MTLKTKITLAFVTMLLLLLGVSAYMLYSLDRLDRTRYKAEAGLTRRGFVPHSHSGLLRNEAGAEDDGFVRPDNDDGGGMDSDVDVDVDVDAWSDEEGPGTGSRGRPRFSERGRERDDLKLPEGDGWTQL